MLRKILRFCGRMLPYVGWMAPVVGQVLDGKLQGIPVAIRDMKQHLQTLYSTQQEVGPALATQMQRLDLLERKCGAIQHALDDLLHEQAEAARQMRRLTAWVQGAVLAGVSGLVILLYLVERQVRHCGLHL
jgi:hypothetical protein